jgi:hypothetical protein
MISVKDVKKANKIVSKLYKTEYIEPENIYVELDDVHYDLSEDYVTVGVRWGIEHEKFPRHYTGTVSVQGYIKSPKQLAHFILGYMYGIEEERYED